MPNYHSEFPQSVVTSSEEDKPIEVNLVYSTRLAKLQQENEHLRRNLRIFSRRTYYLQIENAKLLQHNKQLKSKWLTGIGVTLGTLLCLALIVRV